MRELVADYERLRAAGPVGRAVVVATWGSAPRPAGSVLLATADGRVAGSVSGGCVESAVVYAVGEAIGSGTARLLQFDVTDEQAWEVGLACGGRVEILVEPAVRDEVLAAARGPGGVVVPSVVAAPPPIALGAPPEAIRAAVADAAQQAAAVHTSRCVTVPVPGGDARVFLEVFPRQPTLFIIGAVHVAEALVQLARPLGYRTIVADGREAFLNRDRFPGADELLPLWPDEAFRRVTVDEDTCICILSHDPKFDEPALVLALQSPAGYVGAIGSRRTQARRRERLRAAGVAEHALARLHGPIGLPLGGRQPAEIALAILAEITAARYGASSTREFRVPPA
jgi:xanthine dehydrogenase accessory factor